MLAEARVGTSGYAYREWIGTAYPPGAAPAELLQFYSRQLATVEIAATSSRSPSLEQFAAWSAAVPAGFQFALKLPARIVAELRGPRGAGRALGAFIEAAEQLGEHLGPILVQLPVDFSADRAALSEFLRAAPRGVRLAFEFGHPSWHEESTLRVLSAHNAALVLTDHGEGAPRLELTADFAYVRIRREDDRPDAWAEWAERLAMLTRRGVDVYAFLKHDRKGLAVERALRLSTLLRNESDVSEQPLLT
jgi:uncharacterized protein YecE (DUF72 family)